MLRDRMAEMSPAMTVSLLHVRDIGRMLVEVSGSRDVMHVVSAVGGWTFPPRKARPNRKSLVSSKCCHNSLDIMNPRVVITEGNLLRDWGIKPGSIVTASAFVVKRSSMFGPDADTWDPQRWLEGSDETV